VCVELGFSDTEEKRH